MLARPVIFTLAVLFTLSACGSIGRRDFPPRLLQPASSPLPATALAAAEGHNHWLDSKDPYSKQTELANARALLRLRGWRPESSTDRESIISINSYLSSYYKDTESKIYRTKGSRPSLCIALSGGGIRAAAFGIGVLQGLQDSGQLNSVDIISAVSGGAYATAWFAQNRASGLDDATVLADLFIAKTVDPLLFSLPVTALGVATSFINPLISGSVFPNGIDVPALTRVRRNALCLLTPYIVEIT